MFVPYATRTASPWLLAPVSAMLGGHMWGLGTELVVIATIPLLAYIIRRLKFRLLLKSRAYAENKAALQGFVEEIERNLISLAEIGEAKANALVDGVDSAVKFFKQSPSLVSETIARLLAFHAAARDLMQQHDSELRFYGEHYQACRSLLAKTGYISHTQWRNILDNGLPLLESFARKKPLFRETPSNVTAFLSLHKLVDEHNKAFVEDELRQSRAFFDTLTKYPLDQQQRECCVVDEEAVLVIAGAGSGKTSVIMAKVAYLIKIKGVPPEDILLVSFTNKAAQEMTERIAGCVGEKTVTASTFHKFGLEILRRFGDGRHDIADESLLKRVVHAALSGDDTFVSDGYGTIVRYFAYYFNPDQSTNEYATHGERIKREKSCCLRTMKSMVYDAGEKIALGGECVKSLEEVLIANYLFLNGVKYEYEKPYKKGVVYDNLHRAYRPDFYLPEFDVYLEHYGIDENGVPPPFFTDVEKQKYLDGMRWKRELHQKANNKYVESFSWWNNKGVLFEKLASALEDVGVVLRPCNTSEVFGAIREKAKQQLDEFEKLVASFISLFKSNGFPASYFDDLIALEAETRNATKRQRAFLSIAKYLYSRYQEELTRTGGRDFNDMINEATRIVEKLSPGTLGYKFVIVDEYQDASMSRMRLLKAVIGNSGAHLFCVGDDWQSIFRFAGSDIGLFTRFGDFFDHAVTMKIENTYRNSQELVDIMGRFVMRNPWQLKKELKSGRHCADPIHAFFFDDSGDDESGFHQALREALGAIAKKAEGKDAKVLLLGRTNYEEARIVQSRDLERRGPPGEYAAPRFPNLTLQFLTVHKSKGLEGDYVILLNAENGQMGFPNQIEDDPLLRLVLSAGDSFEFAEERRLFYVALTRTRNSVFILAPASDHSPFLDELFDIGVPNPMVSLASDSGSKVPCPKCKTGELVCRDGPHGRFSACSNYPACDYRVNFVVTAATPRCPDCGGFLVKRHSNNGRPDFWGCSNYPYCRHTDDLDAVPPVAG